MDENIFDKTSLNTVKRLPKRGHYDKDTVFSILDRNFLCHLAWEEDGQPFLIPTAFGRKERLSMSMAAAKAVCFLPYPMEDLFVWSSHRSMGWSWRDLLFIIP